MSQNPTYLSSSLYAQYLSMGLRESSALKALREENAGLPQRNFQTAPEVAHFLSFLIPLLSIRSILELGTFTGYSSLALALALPEDGHLVTCDRDSSTTETAKCHWEKSNVESKITFHLGDISKTLKTLKDSESSFDLIFMDADKRNYETYYEECLSLLAPRGILAIDNTLWRGDALLSIPETPQGKAIQQLNIKIHQDARVSMVMLPMGDGLTLVRKR